MKLTLARPIVMMGLLIAAALTGRSSLGATKERNRELAERARDFSTAAYREVALKKLIEEANRLARKLPLGEKLPIERGDLLAISISPPNIALPTGAFGSISTSNYQYLACEGNKLSTIDWNRQESEPYLRQVRQRYGGPREHMNTNAAYGLATQWLAAAGVDMRALERECTVTFQVAEREGVFAPIFWVLWRQLAASVQGLIPHGTQTVAGVWLVEPERRLLQIGATNSRFILRQSLEVPDRNRLLRETEDAQMRQVFFTTSAYEAAGREALLKEANWAARQLGLREEVPIVVSGLKHVTIATPFISEQQGYFGTIRTRDYSYCANDGNKLSWIERDMNLFDEGSYLASIQAKYHLPKSRMDTNAAYMLATQWLAAVSVDVARMEREFKPSVRAWEFGDQFVPLYEVIWRKPGHSNESLAASVELLEPERLLSSLVVPRAEFIMREPVGVPDRRRLLGLDGDSKGP